MKRLLTFLLILVLPLQFSFATAATYCADREINVESSVDSHFGHHDHVTEAAHTATNDSSDQSDAEPECHVCHLACAKLQTPQIDLAVVHADLPTDAPAMTGISQTEPSPLQRPPIARIA